MDLQRAKAGTMTHDLAAVLVCLPHFHQESCYFSPGESEVESVLQSVIPELPLAKPSSQSQTARDAYS